jgi:hypothetical protein
VEEQHAALRVEHYDADGPALDDRQVVRQLGRQVVRKRGDRELA